MWSWEKETLGALCSATDGPQRLRATLDIKHASRPNTLKKQIFPAFKLDVQNRSGPRAGHGILLLGA